MTLEHTRVACITLVLATVLAACGPRPAQVGSAGRSARVSAPNLSLRTLNGGSDEVVMEDGRIEAIPTTFIVDQEGRIYRKHVGYRERTHIEADLQHLLAGGREISGEGS